MTVVVIVALGEKLEETLKNVSQAIRDAKKRFRKSVCMQDIAVRGPRKGIADGRLVSLQYRLSDENGEGLDTIWDRVPDVVIHAGTEWEERRGTAHS